MTIASIESRPGRTSDGASRTALTGRLLMRVDRFHRMRSPGALVMAIACALLAGPAHAHIVSDRELRHVRQLPEDSMHSALAFAAPAVGGPAPSRPPRRWNGIGTRRPAVFVLIDAAARSDTARAELAWAAIEEGFEHQRPDGWFDRSQAGGPDEWLDTAAWLGGVTRGLIAVMNSTLADRFRFRYALLKPKLQRSVDALAAGADSARGLNENRAGFLVVTAGALLLAEGTFHEPRYGRAGQPALVAGLALQKPNGLLPTNGTANRAEHVLGLESLQALDLYLPSPSIDRATSRGEDWLKHHRGPAKTTGSRAESKAEVAPGEVQYVLLFSSKALPAPAGGTAHHVE
jgi:hypothetical protein